MGTNNIVLIHGMWLTRLSLECWLHRYNRQEYRVRAPAWPGMEHDVHALRRHPDTYAQLGFREIVDHYESIVLKFDDPPILIGHGFGGLIVQSLLDRGLGSCGVAIASTPIKGIWTLPYSTMRVVSPQLVGSGARQATMLSPRQFHHAFTHASDVQESMRLYERHAVPGIDRVLLQAALANLNPFAETTVNVRRHNRPPLLLVAGEHDRLSPPATVRANQRAYRRSLAVTDYVEFPGRTHLLVCQSGWEEVADHALDWAREQQRQRLREARRMVRSLHSRELVA